RSHSLRHEMWSLLEEVLRLTSAVVETRNSQTDAQRRARTGASSRADVDGMPLKQRYRLEFSKRRRREQQQAATRGSIEQRAASGSCEQSEAAAVG
ncbi:MAG: hypothetical protein ACKPKO_34030, partial [Candidatus Fonsibacter sp.]